MNNQIWIYTIYMVMNKLTGQWYVGSTLLNLKDRFRQHKYDKTKLGENIREYGKRNFEYWILSKCDMNIFEANELERLYIVNLEYEFGYQLCLNVYQTSNMYGVTANKLNIRNE